MRRLLDLLYLATGILGGLILMAICAVMMVLSVGREIGINFRGGDEIGAWLCAASGFMAAAYTFRHGELIRVGLLVERLKGRARWLAELAALAMALVIVAVFAGYTIDMVLTSRMIGEYTQGVIAIPIWVPQAGMTFGIVVLGIAVLDELVSVARGARPSYERDPPKTQDEVIERAAQSGV